MQVKAHGPQEIPGAANGARLTRCQQPAARAIGADQFRHALHIKGIARQPIKRLQIAQRAASFLDMGFHHVRAIAITPMALLFFGELCFKKGFQPDACARGAKCLIEAREDGRIARDQPRIQQRGHHCGVAFRFLQTFTARSGRVPNLQPHIPEQIEHEFNGLLALCPHAAIGQEQQINIGKWRQHTAAITTGRNQRMGFLAVIRRVHRFGIAVNAEH